MKKNQKAWSVLAAATGINFIAGLLYIWSVISRGLVQEMGWTSKQASLPYTCATISFVVAMMVFGRIQDKMGPKVTVVTAGALIGTGLILSGLFLSPWTMVLTFGIMTGAGIGISNVSTTPPAVKWFPPRKKGMVTGIVVAGVGIASVFYSPLSHSFIATVGIARTLIYIGVFALVMILLFSRFLANPPENHLYVEETGKRQTAKQQEKAPADLHSPDVDSHLMLRRLDFYLLWIMLAFASAAGLMIIGHAASITKVQIGWEGGFILVGMLAVFNAAGRFIGGAISDKIDKMTLLRIIFLVQAMNMLLFTSYRSVPMLAVGVALAGLSYGATFSVFPSTLMHLYGVKHFGANYGLMMSAWGVGGIIGPMTAAAVFDASGGYGPAYLIAFSLLVVASVLTIFFKGMTGIRGVKI